MSSQTIGHSNANFWTYNTDTGVIDLSRGTTSGDGALLSLETTTNNVQINPATTAMIIIDMQNFFLSPALRRPQAGSKPTAGEKAAQTLIETGIPAARQHGIRLVWVNWGLTEEDIATMPPSLMRTFGVYKPVAAPGEPKIVSAPGSMIREKNASIYRGLGMDLGTIDLGQGDSVEGGRMLMRDTWNAALYAPLEKEYQAGMAIATSAAGPSSQESPKPDVVIHKNRMSGLWGASTDLEEFLKSEGITTLLFSGVNTDQCVGGTLMDAFSKGYDCIMLRDGVATSSPAAASEAWEYNSMNCWGFVTSCDALKKARRP